MKKTESRLFARYLSLLSPLLAALAPPRKLGGCSVCLVFAKSCRSCNDASSSSLLLLSHVIASGESRIRLPVVISPNPSAVALEGLRGTQAGKARSKGESAAT